jgi:hypothetical protein
MQHYVYLLEDAYSTVRMRSLPVPPRWSALKTLPPLLKVIPSARLTKVPLIGLAEILLVAVKTAPGVTLGTWS